MDVEAASREHDPVSHRKQILRLAIVGRTQQHVRTRVLKSMHDVRLDGESWAHGTFAPPDRCRFGGHERRCHKNAGWHAQTLPLRATLGMRWAVDFANVVVVTNPRSRRNRNNPGLRQTMANVMGSRGALVAPPSLEALDAEMVRCRDEGVGMVGVHGGDGTLHRTLTALVRAYGEDASLPRVVVLRGGTMNIIGGSIGATWSLKRTLEAMLSDASAFHEVARPCLRLAFGESRPSYGFLVGNGVVSRFLEVFYEVDDPSPVKALVMVLRASGSVLVGGPLSRRLLARWTGSVRLEADLWEARPWLGVAVGAITQLGLGSRVFNDVDPQARAFQVLGIAGGVGRLVRAVPRLYLGRGVHHAEHQSAVSERCVMAGDGPFGFTIDGDLYVASQGTLEVTPGPTIRFLSPKSDKGRAT